MSATRPVRPPSRVAVAAAALALLGVVSGCGADEKVAVSADPKLMDGAELHAAAQRSAAVTSGRFSVDSNLSVDVAAVADAMGMGSMKSELPASRVDMGLDLSGSFSGNRSESSTTVDLGQLGGPGELTGPVEIESVLDGSDLYVKTRGTWRRVTDPALEGAVRGGGWRQVSETLLALQAAGRVDDLGSEDVRGVSTAHRRVTVSHDAYVAMIDKQLGSLGEQFPLDAVMGTGDVPVDLWIDADGFVRRLKTVLDSPGVRGETVTEIWDAGAEVSIDVPTVAAEPETREPI